MTSAPFYFATMISFLLLNCKVQKKEKNSVAVQLVNQIWFNDTSLLKHVKVLSSDAFEGRRTGTKGAIKAKNYIKAQFKTLNVSPLIPNYSQPFTFKSRNKTYNGENILGLIKGTESPESYIVISAHYDHEGIKKGKIYYGADDDGEGRGDNWTNSSDHASFHDKAIPFLYFGVEDHEDYHKPTDDFKNIPHIFYKNVVYNIIYIFEKLDTMTL